MADVSGRAGKAHVYPRLAPTCEWDTAASHVIVTEAGGEVLQSGVSDEKVSPSFSSVAKDSSCLLVTCHRLS